MLFSQSEVNLAALRTVKLSPAHITWLFRKTCTTLRSSGLVSACQKTRHFSPNPTAFRRKALSEQLLAMISASVSDNRSSERLSLIDRRTVEASAKGNYRPLAASPSPSCSRRLSGSARSVKNTRRAPPFRLGDARVWVTHRFVKDHPHDPDILSLRHKGLAGHSRLGKTRDLRYL
jgi:hypothetical protein